MIQVDRRTFKYHVLVGPADLRDLLERRCHVGSGSGDIAPVSASWPLAPVSTQQSGRPDLQHLKPG